MQYEKLEHQFVKHIPEHLQPGRLYVSMDYGSVAHACCCGCGEDVVTPLTPTDWKLTFDGESISLHPSIGSWTLPCRSHYVIRQSRVHVAEPWSDRQIEAERRRDRLTKAKHYKSLVSQANELPEVKSGNNAGRIGWCRRLWRRMFSN